MNKDQLDTLRETGGVATAIENFHAEVLAQVIREEAAGYDAGTVAAILLTVSASVAVLCHTSEELFPGSFNVPLESLALILSRTAAIFAVEAGELDSLPTRDDSVTDMLDHLLGDFTAGL